MMTLAILVTYIFDRRISNMVRVHLDYIRRYTSAPYRIYGAAPRLGEKERELLENYPEVTIVDQISLPPWQPGGPLGKVIYEHNGYLEILRARAADDGAECFVTLHQDSFPIEEGWDRRLAAELDRELAFASIVPYSYNACLFWTRDWQQTHTPLLVPQRQRSSTDFEEFLRANPEFDTVDGGIGFHFAAWRRGQTYYALEPTAPNIWGDCILHLVGSTRLVVGHKPSVLPPKVDRRFSSIGRRVTSILPPQTKSWIRQRLRRFVTRGSLSTGRAGNLNNKELQIQLLVEDPETFISACRTGEIAASMRADPESGNLDALRAAQNRT